MTVVNPDSIAGITSVTSSGTTLEFYDVNGNLLDVSANLTGELTVGTGATISSPGANIIDFETNGSERLRIDSNGRLLKGITASSTLADGFGAAFQIQGTSATSSSISITRNSAGENPSYITFAKSRGTSVGSNTAIADGDNLGDIDFKGSDGAGDFNLFAKIRASVDGTPGSSDAPGRLSFFTTANNGISNIERVRIDSSGKVAIGNASPQQLLHVWPDTANTTSAFIRVTSGDRNSNTGIDLGSDADGDGRLNVVSNGNLKLYTNNNERLRITSAGKIGVNTTSALNAGAMTLYSANEGEGTATGQLELKDTAPFGSTPTGGIIFSGHHTAGSQAIFAGIRGFKANNGNGDLDGCLAFDVRKHGAVAYEAMRITEDGKIGINVTNPTSQLQVDAGTSSNANVCQLRNDSTSAYAKTDGGINTPLSIQSTGTNSAQAAGIQFTLEKSGETGAISEIGAVRTGNGESALVFRTRDNSTGRNERLRITSAGSVGIGTIAPDVDNRPGLHIHSNHNDSCRLNITTPNKTQCRLGYFGLSNRFGMDVHNGLQIRDASVSFATRMLIDSSGRVLVGATAKRNINNQNGNSAGDTTTPLLYVEGTGDSKSLTIVSNNTSAWRGSVLGLARTRGTSVGDSTVVQDDDNIGQIVFAAGDGNDLLSNAATIRADVDGTPGSNDTPGRLVFSTTADGAVTATERMRIENWGAIRSGTSSAIQAEKYTWFRPETDQNTLAYFHQGASSNVSGIMMRHGRGLSGFAGKMISFLRSDATEVGSITVGASATAFNTSSDYRLKENVTAIIDGITRLKTLKPYRFNFKDDTNKPIVDGFFAHEVTAVPEAITGTKDEVDSDNNPVYQSIDQSKLVPLLTAALQEAISKIETLEAEAVNDRDYESKIDKLIDYFKL